MPSLPTLDLHKTGDGVSTLTSSLLIFCPVTQCVIHTTTFLLCVAPVWCARVSEPAKQHKGGGAICSLWPGVWVGPEGAETSVWYCGRFGSLPNWQPLHQQQVSGSSHHHDRYCNRWVPHLASWLPRPQCNKTKSVGTSGGCSVLLQCHTLAFVSWGSVNKYVTQTTTPNRHTCT